MKLLKLWRTFKEGSINFYRNGWLSFATVSVLSISLYIISVTLILGITANMILKGVQEKISVSVYFNSSVSTEDIQNIKNELAVYQEIKSISYVSKEEALTEFKNMGSSDPAISKALEEIGDNPLLESLVIKAKSPDQYEIIVKSLNNAPFSKDINRITFEENKLIIERMNTIIKLVEQVGLTLGIVFIFIGILITFNAIRLTMYAHKQEFEVMRLVGASNLYIRMPFVFEGILYGFVSAILVMVLLFTTAKTITPLIAQSMEGGNLVSFYLQNFFIIFGGLLASGIGLGVISGFIAIRRYLKI